MSFVEIKRRAGMDCNLPGSETRRRDFKPSFPVVEHRAHCWFMNTVVEVGVVYFRRVLALINLTNSAPGFGNFASWVQKEVDCEFNLLQVNTFGI
jgi:hypothetical protein